MNAPRQTRHAHAATMLAAAIGLSLAAGAAWSAGPIADASAQDQSTQQLQKTQSDVMPPPANTTDANRGARTDRDAATQADRVQDQRAGTATDRWSTEGTPPTDANRASQWNHLDADGDGRISRSEGSSDPDFSSNFEMMDANSDGYINNTEMGTRGSMDHDMHEPEEDEQR